MAASGLSCSTQALRCDVGFSLVVACGFSLSRVVARGLQSTWAP